MVQKSMVVKKWNWFFLPRIDHKNRQNFSRSLTIREDLDCSYIHGDFFHPWNLIHNTCQHVVWSHIDHSNVVTGDLLHTQIGYILGPCPCLKPLESSFQIRSLWCHAPYDATQFHTTKFRAMLVLFVWPIWDSWTAHTLCCISSL